MTKVEFGTMFFGYGIICFPMAVGFIVDFFKSSMIHFLHVSYVWEKFSSCYFRVGACSD